MRHEYLSNRYRIPRLLPLKLGVSILVLLKRMAPLYSKESNAKKVIFVHIPKAAGSSVGHAILGTDIVGHYPCYLYRNYDSSKFNEYFKFAVIRDPYDRLVSAYNFLMEGGKGKWDEECRIEISKRASTFEEFVENVLDKEFTRKWVHFTPQSDFICNIDSDEVLLDKIVCLEKIEEEIKPVFSRFGIKESLGFSNKTRKKSPAEFTSKMLDIIEDVYARDFRVLGYGMKRD